MTGISEILVLVLLICLILIVPRMMKPAPKKVPQKHSGKLSPGMRAGIVASILLPFVAALIVKPWEGRLAFYVCIGILPVILSWAALWVAAGKKK